MDLCPLCGSEIEQTGKGRPRVYCGSNCRRIDQLIGWLEDLVVDFKPTPDKAKKFRGKLFSLSNLLNGKG